MPQPSIQELLSPELLHSIGDYSLTARIAVDGFLSGIHRSTSLGSGSEFVQYRNYTPGDDLKLLDWKLLARRNRRCTKVFEEETGMQCALLLDGSSSMAYQGAQAVCSKFRYGCLVAACLAHLCCRQTDQPGLFIYSDRILAAARTGRGAGSLRHIFASLEKTQPEGTAGSPLVFQQIGNFLKKRGMAILLTDGYCGSAALQSFLMQLKYTGHDCLVCQILDPDEIKFPFQQTFLFQDSETGRDITVTGRLARQDYLKRMHGFLAEIRQTCRNCQTDYLLLDTSTSLKEPLTAWLSHREAMNR